MAAGTELEVESVDAGGACEQAGLLVGDRIISVNGVQVGLHNEVAEIFQAASPGPVEVVCYRKAAAIPVIKANKA